jgi:hypothetical protein
MASGEALVIFPSDGVFAIHKAIAMPKVEWPFNKT